MAKAQDFSHEELEGYDSSFEDERGEAKKPKLGSTDSAISLAKKVQSTTTTGQCHSQGLPSKAYFDDQQRRAESYRNHYFALNAFERHRKLINDYVLYYPGSTSLLKRDSSKDKNDRDIIQENHRFLWDDSEDPTSWEKQIAKKYYDKLFKEYGLCDLSKYIENKIAIRWRTEAEVVDGKGQFICGEKRCSVRDELRTWEVNFAYLEDRTKKNALVKLRLCTPCSLRLNFNHQRKEVTKKPKRRRFLGRKANPDNKKKSKSTKTDNKNLQIVDDSNKTDIEAPTSASSIDNIWKETVVAPELKSREDEFDEYLDDLFL